MTDFTFLFLLLLAHVIGDFTLQSSEIVKSKNQYGRGYLYHILIIFFSYIAFTFFYFSCKWIYAILIIVITHSIIDYLKIKIGRSKKITSTGNTIALIADQILHLSFMLFVFYLFRPWIPNQIYIKIVSEFFSHAQIINHLPDKFIFLSACYLFLTMGGTVFVKTFSGRYKNGIALSSKRYVTNGITIGETERIILFTLFILQLYIWAAVVIILKIVWQYYVKRSEERDFKGTLYSLGLALIVGAVYNTIFIW
ncbi:MAG: DUF3307 domain-containing protein [Proteobacteria bacterium]|nr:DUF3307 domain-containing protein [Pseudomonadota bacterium]